MPFSGPVVPFGAMVEYHPISAKEQTRLHLFGAKVLPGSFLGNAWNAGRIWKGDIIVADVEELEEMDASELHARSLNTKEVLTAQRSEKLHIPNRRWNGENLRERTASENIHSVRNEEKNKKIFKEYQMNYILHPCFKTTHRGMMRKQKMTFGLTGEFIHRHHVVPRVKLYVPSEESFPILLNYIDVTRTTHTSLEVMLEKQIEHYWNVDGEKELSDAWTGFTKIRSSRGKATRRIFMVGEETYKETKLLVLMMCETWEFMSDAAKKKQSKMGKLRNQKSPTMPDNWEEYSWLNQTMKNSSSQWKPLVQSWKFRCKQGCLAKYR